MVSCVPSPTSRATFLQPEPIPDHPPVHPLPPFPAPGGGGLGVLGGLQVGPCPPPPSMPVGGILGSLVTGYLADCLGRYALSLCSFHFCLYFLKGVYRWFLYWSLFFFLFILIFPSLFLPRRPLMLVLYILASIGWLTIGFAPSLPVLCIGFSISNLYL